MNLRGLACFRAQGAELPSTVKKAYIYLFIQNLLGAAKADGRQVTIAYNIVNYQCVHSTYKIFK